MMPHKQWGIGEEVLAADFNTYVQNQTVERFATAAARTTALASPALNQLTMLDSNPGEIDYWNGTVWVPIRGAAVGAQVAAGETWGNAFYGDLTTPGPAASLLTGTTALLTISYRFLAGAVGNIGVVSYAVSGSSSIAAADTTAMFSPGLTATNSSDHCRQWVVSGLTPGVNTFTIKYKVSGGTCTFTNRTISVVAL